MCPHFGDACTVIVLGVYYYRELYSPDFLRRKSDTWTVFLQTEQPATSKSPPFLTMYPSQSPGFSYKDGVMLKLSPSVDLGIYAQHHCWLLFSSLTLSMANAVNNNTGGELLRGSHAWKLHHKLLLQYMI